MGITSKKNAITDRVQGVKDSRFRVRKNDRHIGHNPTSPPLILRGGIGIARKILDEPE
jgi:hypothetical protein